MVVTVTTVKIVVSAGALQNIGIFPAIQAIITLSAGKAILPFATVNMVVAITAVNIVGKIVAAQGIVPIRAGFVA